MKTSKNFLPLKSHIYNEYKSATVTTINNFKRVVFIKSYFHSVQILRYLISFINYLISKMIRTRVILGSRTSVPYILFTYFATFAIIFFTYIFQITILIASILYRSMIHILMITFLMPAVFNLVNNNN